MHARSNTALDARANRLPIAVPFWQSRLLWLGMAIFSTLPFLITTILPFNDLPNHVGRHYVFLNYTADPFLQRFYGVHWTMVGNLGIDMIVRAVGPWLGAESATRLAVGTIPPLTIAGIYFLSRELNTEVAPAALLALPLSVNWPLITGFANFSFSAAIALLALALWVRLRPRHYFFRAALFVPVVFFTWLSHTAGWGLLGLGIAAYEVARATQSGWSAKRLLSAPFQLLPFVPTLLFIVLWRQKASNGAAITVGDDFLRSKLVSAASLFREHFLSWDAFSIAVFVVGILFFFFRGGRKVIRPASFIAAAYLLAFLICPQEIFKSGFADRRLMTYGALMVPLAIGLAPEALTNASRRRMLQIAALACITFFVGRIAVSSVVWRDASTLHEARLSLIEKVPAHSRIFGLVVEACDQKWNRVGRPDHLQQYALVRRQSMINGMFQNPGLNQVEALFGDETAVVDPNMLAVVHDGRCPVGYIKQTLQSAMTGFARNSFDYVWIISEEPVGEHDSSGLTLLGTRNHDQLYKVDGNP